MRDGHDGAAFPYSEGKAGDGALRKPTGKADESSSHYELAHGAPFAGSPENGDAKRR